MAHTNLILTNEELQAVYQLIKEYEEKIPENEEEFYDYADDFEELIDKKIIKTILKKISRVIPEKDKIDIDKDFLRKKYYTFNNSVDERVYSMLKKAFEQLKTVEIEYFNMESAEFIKRKINVYYTSAKYTIGYCHLRKAIRKFRTSRMKSAKITNSSYKIPKSFDKNDY